MESSPAHFAGRGLDRLAQFAPRRAATMGTDLENLDMIAELRIGAAVAHLRQQARLLPRAEARRLDDLFVGVAGWFEAKMHGAPGDGPADAILTDIDTALAAFGAAPDRASLLSALTELRRSLFPDAPAPALSPRLSPEPDHDPRVARLGSPEMAAE